jgi:hypothetical protein
MPTPGHIVLDLLPKPQIAEHAKLNSDLEGFNINNHENQQEQSTDVESVASEVLEVSQSVIYGMVVEIYLTQL